MKLLALDTSSMTATVALMREDRLVGEFTLNHERNHSQKMMPMIEELMNNCQWTPKDIDVFAVSVGPGSFTGLRIGIATIKAMAQALDKPVIGVSTLDALAFNMANSQDLICPIIDGQRDLVYTGLYQWIDGQLVEVIEKQVIHIDDLVGKLKEEGEKVYFLGDGLAKFGEVLKEGLGRCFQIPFSKHLIPSASSVGELAKIKYGQGQYQRPEELVPIYMRKSQAEKQFEERMKGRE